MTSFGVRVRTDGPLGKQLGWGASRHPGDMAERPQTSEAEPIRAPRTVPEPEPEPDNLDYTPVLTAMRTALDSRPASEQTKRLARMTALVLIEWATDEATAARALNTLPGAIEEAHQVVDPVIARDARELSPSAECFEAIFGPLVEDEQRWRMRELVQITAETFGVDMWTLRSERRHHVVAKARQCAMWLCFKFTYQSKSAIGQVIGKRDCATVLHGCRVMDRLIARAPRIDGGSDPRRWAELIAERVRQG